MCVRNNARKASQLPRITCPFGGLCAVPRAMPGGGEQVDVMLPFFGHHDNEIARAAVRVYVMRLYRAYDIVCLEVAGNSGGVSAPPSPTSDIGLPSMVRGRAALLSPSHHSLCPLHASQGPHAFPSLPFSVLSSLCNRGCHCCCNVR